MKIRQLLAAMALAAVTLAPPGVIGAYTAIRVGGHVMQVADPKTDPPPSTDPTGPH
ncbi:MAG TPA: hypothetical protein VJT31_30755 [Rugosimonospora sp.]|nr:hypothetical protein [Rugosimonospora sp.]